MGRREATRTAATVLLAAFLAAPSPALAASKTVEKAAFAAALLGLGGVVRWLRHRDDEARERQSARIRAAWGPPARVRRLVRGFDFVRIEEYCRAGRRATVYYVNGRLGRVVLDD
jgi:hypothetical protein